MSPNSDFGRHQGAFDLVEIGGLIGEPIPLRLKFRIWLDDIHIRRRQALRFGQQVGIQTELQDRPCLCFTGELRIDRYIRPTAQTARNLTNEIS